MVGENERLQSLKAEFQGRVAELEHEMGEGRQSLARALTQIEEVGGGGGVSVRMTGRTEMLRWCCCGPVCRWPGTSTPATWTCWRYVSPWVRRDPTILDERMAMRSSLLCCLVCAHRLQLQGLLEALKSENVSLKAAVAAKERELQAAEAGLEEASEEARGLEQEVGVVVPA